ncbi:MAG TPA: hypothetical protein GX739_06170 [Firmicutes bacterium]|nr:hypothetical protein [Bacillota bacterium]
MWIDKNRTLIIDRNLDTWQLPLVAASGAYLGNIVAEVIEPLAFMVRYFLVFDPNSQRRFLLPCDLVTDIDKKVFCDISPTQTALLPEYGQRLDRNDEKRIYQIVNRTPYWEETIDDD